MCFGYNLVMTLPVTTASSLADRLRAEIDEGAWAPGAALRQDELAERFGASRIPVREALQMLQAQGLVTIAPNRGAFVVALDADEVEEIFDMRVMLEGHLLASALPRHNHKTMGRLEAMQAALEAEDQRAGWLGGDRSFHEALYAPADKPRTLATAMTLRGQVERYAMNRLGPGSRRAEWKREHRAVLAAVRERDAPRAVAALAEHLNETRAAVLRSLKA